MMQRLCSRLVVTAFMRPSVLMCLARRPSLLTIAGGEKVPIRRVNLREIGSISRLYSTEAKWTNEALDEVVKNNKIVVFMKGTPLEPMCGFSKAVVTILQMHGIVEFSAHNVLEDEELRQKVKEYSSWPTVPQVYINGEFVGGCDIMIQLHQNGELINELEKVGYRSVLAEEND